MLYAWDMGCCPNCKRTERDEMLKIRDFARLAEVSITTLRYYDEIGLLKPIHVDPETGYRFHTMDQLPHLHRIYEVVLKAVRPITGVKPIDHLLILHAESEDEHTISSVEIVAPVDWRDTTTLITRSAGRLTQCELPAVPRMASTLHHGPPSLAMLAYQALGTWVENNAYTIVGPRRMIFLRQGEHLDDALTEIQFPVEKVA